MSASKVLDLAVEQGLLDAKVIAELRKQIAESKFVVTPEAIAKVLVDHGHLTPFQARKLVNSAVGTDAPSADAAAPAVPAKSRPAAPATAPAKKQDLPDEFSLADDDGNAAPSPAAAPPPPEEDIIDLEPVEPAPKPKPAPRQPAPPKPAAARPTPTPAPQPKPKPAPPPPAAVEEEVIDLEPVAAQPSAPAPAPRPPAASRPAPPPPAPVVEELTPLTPLAAPASSPAPRGGTAVAAAAAPAAVVKPIDDLFGDPLSAPADPLANPALLGEPPQDAKPARKKKGGNVWDSPLLLIGGGLLGVILIAMALLFYSLTRGNAAELFAQAEADYASGSYASAIKGYDTYLKKYPDDPEASKARVRRGMAQLRQITDGGKDPRRGLQMAKEVLPQIETEEKFAEARLELSSILPDIADGFAGLAADAATTEKKEELVTLANEAMELVSNPTYIPASLRKDREARIAGILDKLKLAQRGIDEDKELVAAVGKIGAAAQQGDAAAAYKIRADLLKVYPALEAHPDLIAAILQVGERERQLVQVSQPATAALTDDPQPETGARVILAVREGPSGGGPAAPAFVLADGAVYALDSASGRVLWRRFVGYQTQAHPVALAVDGGFDAVVVDGRDHQLLRLAGATGALVWRQPIGEMFAPPAVTEDWIYVTTRKGRVLQIAASSGEVVQQAQLPQGATMPLSINARQKRLAQLGEHSTLFILNSETLAGIESYYLGHKTGAILIPPVTVLDHVLVAESPGDDYTLLHVLAVDAESQRLTEVGRPFRLRGRVLTPLAVSKRRVAALTDLGQVAVYEVDGTNQQQPVRSIGGLEAGERPAVTGWCALEDNRLWTAGKRCTLLEVQASLQQVGRKWTLHQDDSFVAPLQVFGQTLVHLRRRNGWPGLVVEGCSAADGKTLWTTQIGVPIVALEVSESRKAVDVLTAGGKLFTLTGEQLRGGIVDVPTFSPPPGSGPAILSAATLSGDGQTLLWTEARAGGRLFEYNIAAGGAPIATDLPAGAAAAAPAVPWGGRLLTALASGGLALLDSKTGAQSVQPFVPPLAPGTIPEWTRPAILPGDASCLISDGRRAVYRVALNNQPQPHLAQALEIPTEPAVVSPLVVAGGVLYGWKRGEAADSIAVFDPQALPTVGELSLQGHVQSGPYAVGGLMLLSSEPEGLICVEAGPKIRWQQPLAHGPLAGSPLALPDGDLLVIYQSGHVCRVSAETGEELGPPVAVAQPLGPAARVFGQFVFLSGSDGVIHRTTLPPRP
jgi:tetratricopeptide (TPR) repeat protein